MRIERVAEPTGRIGCVWVVTGMLLFSGCDAGPQLGQVEGGVRLDGEPVPDARVIFQPRDGGPASHAVTDASGRYELIYSEGQPGAVLGTHRVTVETYRIRLNESGEAVEHPERVPAKYNAQSELTAEVALGMQTINFDLEKD